MLLFTVTWVYSRYTTKEKVMDWKMILGVGFWLLVELAIIAGTIYAIRIYVWKPFLNYFDLNKESIR